MNKFISYKEVSQPKLKSIAKILANLKTDNIHSQIKREFLNYLRDENIYQRDLNFVIKREPLESIENVIILVEFNTHPFASHDDLYRLRGQARLLSFPRVSSSIPVIYIMPNKGSNTIDHEKVHLCQYLLDSAYPLTHDQRKILHEMNIPDGIRYFVESSGKLAGIDYLINQVCYQTWIELEANFSARNSSTELDMDSAFEIIKAACRSAVPIETLEIIYAHPNVGLDHSFDLDETKSKIYKFFDELEESVIWVEKLVKEAGFDSLSKAIDFAHNDIKIEAFGDSFDELLGDPEDD